MLAGHQSDASNTPTSNSKLPRLFHSRESLESSSDLSLFLTMADGHAQLVVGANGYAQSVVGPAASAVV